ncbi:NHLP bacteriocin system secretion protein [Gammaproteobacteria bacterium]
MAATKEQLFRKVALERLSSPEQLDTLIRVITLNAWIALAPFLVMIVLAIAWSWLGSIPMKVSGRCILLNPNGVADITSAVSGRVIDVPIKVGDLVREGQEVAHVAQPELLDRIEKAESRLREMEAQGRVTRTFSKRSEALTAESLAQNRTNLESQIKASLARSRLAMERTAVQEQLLKDGLVTAQTVVATRQEKLQADLEAEGLRNQVKQLELRHLEAEKLTRAEVANIESQINEARRTLDSLKAMRRQTADIVSPFAGRVVELKTGTGMLLNQGSPVLTVERVGVANAGLQAVIYVSATDGKKVRSGMTAQIIPSTVRREEYGFMVGEVFYVADYPATPQSMSLLLQNETLARDLAGNEPPFEARAALKSATNISGYLWSSAAGAPVKLTSGTLCQADIVVSRRRPISFVVPLFKQSLGLD